MFDPNVPVAEQLVINAEDLRPKIMTPVQQIVNTPATQNTRSNMTTGLFSGDTGVGDTYRQSVARNQEMNSLKKSSLAVAQLGGYGAYINAGGVAGGMLGQGLGKLAGGVSPQQQAQNKLDELMKKHPNPKTYEEYMALSSEFMTAGMTEMGEKFHKMAQDMKTTKTTANLDLQKLHDSLAYLESVSGITLNPLQRKHWLARVKKTVSVGEWGSVDTGKTVFNSILSDMKLKGKETNFKFPDTQETGVAEIKKKEALDKKVKSLSTDLIKATNAEHAISRIEDAMAKYKNSDGTWKDIPGFSSWEKFTRSAEGDKLSSLWENLIGELRNDRFGSVLTKGETELFEKIKTGNWLYLPDSAVIDFVESMRARVDAEKDKVRAGYDKNVTSEYDSRRQVFNDELSSKIEAARTAGYSDAQIEAFIRGGK